jgi:hypothetical protein
MTWANVFLKRQNDQMFKCPNVSLEGVNVPQSYTKTFFLTLIHGGNHSRE